MWGKAGELQPRTSVFRSEQQGSLLTLPHRRASNASSAPGDLREFVGAKDFCSALPLSPRALIFLSVVLRRALHHSTRGPLSSTPLLVNPYLPAFYLALSYLSPCPDSDLGHLAVGSISRFLPILHQPYLFPAPSSFSLTPLPQPTLPLGQIMDSWRWRPSVEKHSFRFLIIVPVVLAVATAATLFIHSDYNLVALYSQCHAHARLPSLSRLPVLGPPACYLVSFFKAAVTSGRAFAVMAEILSFVAGLLTVYTVEGARICNAPNVLIAYPTGPLLIFNMIGGAFIWQLLIIPAFFHRARAILKARGDAHRDDEAEVSPLDPNLGKDSRHLQNDSEAIAIPVGVALGFILPSILMISLATPTAVALWFFSPIYVTLIRKAVRALVPPAKRLLAATISSISSSTTPDEVRSLHLESHRASLALVYAAPVLCSALAHWLLVWHATTQKDDRLMMTRKTLGFIEIDIVFTGFTVLYWLLVEAGWQVVAVMLGVSVVLGPGAGICAGWVYREGSWHEIFGRGLGRHSSSLGQGAEEREGGADEQTPLLS